MSTCDEACDHLFEAATLSAQLVEVETECDRLRAQLDTARGLLAEWNRAWLNRTSVPLDETQALLASKPLEKR